MTIDHEAILLWKSNCGSQTDDGWFRKYYWFS